MAEKLCKLRKYGGGSGGAIGTPVAGTFNTPANSNPVSIDCTGFNYVAMSIQRGSVYIAEVLVDLSSNEVSIAYNTSPSLLTVSVSSSNHIVTVAINGANTARTQVYFKF